MEKEILFLRLCDELAFNITLNDQYEILGISKHLRELLIDGNALVHQVNKKYKLKLYFGVAEYIIPSGISSWSIQDGIDPTVYQKGNSPKIKRLSLDEFLHQVVFIHDGNKFTVQDIIQYNANIAGGVHYTKPQKTIDKKIEEIASFELDNVSVVVRQLIAIANIVLKCLAPLKLKIQQEYPFIGNRTILSESKEQIQNIAEGGEIGIVRNPEFVYKGQPQIFLDSPTSYYLESQGYLDMGTIGNLGEIMGKGFTFGIDIKTELNIEQIIGGTRESSGTGIIFYYNAENIIGRITIKIFDNQSKSLIAFAQTSANPAKRLIITATPNNNEVSFYELRVKKCLLTTYYSLKQSPNNFSNFKYPFLISGYNLDGTRRGKFVGFVANAFFLNRVASKDEIRKLM